MKRKPTVASLMQEIADEFRAAPVVATHEQFWDYYDRAHSRVSVELCQGVWHTFYRMFRGQGDPHVKAHADRDAANIWALEFIGR